MARVLRHLHTWAIILKIRSGCSKFDQGFTGPAQIENRDEEKMLEGQADPEQYYITQLMPKKLEIDLDYIEKQSVASDLLWLIKTPFVIVFSHR